MKNWIDSIYKHCDVTIPKVLIGNKVDLTEQRATPENVARKLAEEHHMQYFETSAMLNKNVGEMMQHVME